MDQQVQPEQQQTLPTDIEALLHPQTQDPAAQAQPVVDPAQVVHPPAPVVQQPVAPPTPSEPQVPLHVLLDERKERQAYQRQIQQFIEAQQRASQPQQQPIDPDVDPGSAIRALAERNAALERSLQERAVHNRADTSEMLAKSKYGAQAVEAARDAAIQARLGNHFLNQPDPYEEVMKWHRGQVAATEIGDPAAYKEKLKQEILAEITRGTVPGQPARPGVPQVLPPSLSTAGRAGVTVQPVPDASDFFKTQLFAKPQRT